MVKSLAAILEEIDRNFEIAGLTCGASKLTVIRTVTLPLFRAGLATGLILVLAKSLSDTGGVVNMLLTIGSEVTTGTVLINNWKHSNDPTLESGLSLIAILMIFISLILLLSVNLIAMKAKFNVSKIWYKTESTLSKGVAPKVYEITTFVFFILVIQIPSFFIFSFVFTATPSSTGTSILDFIVAVFNSFVIGGTATGIGLIIGIPLAIIIARNENHKKFSAFLDNVVNIPYIIPSAALGLSVSLFWTANNTISIPANAVFILVILSHAAMTMPYIIRNAVGALSELDPVYEEISRSLGARPFQVFTRVTFPSIKSSVLAGSIMAFTRSVGETGATLAVSTGVVTAPILIMQFVKNNQFFEAAVTTIALIFFSSLLILLANVLSTRSRRGGHD